MTDRDYFAAAALTGMLAQGDDGSFSEASYARGAYRWADAMLCERSSTNLAEISIQSTDEERLAVEASSAASLRGDAEVAKLRLEAAHAEIASLREAIRRLADQDATLSVCEGNVTVTMDATLTDAEREAVEWCVEMAVLHATECEDEIAALRGLLRRTK